ncbi:hypothetical protein GCM10010195_66930 [Kitasatospora griseola]|nr:hypothetical protein GCM10010195_66930 [Kitasatospora griseola]
MFPLVSFSRSMRVPSTPSLCIVLIEFDSFEQAVAAYESEAYQKALVALPDGVERDFRIIEGID